jgi:predicted TIM-barrel fold metal-dependent hydrolase
MWHRLIDALFALGLLAIMAAGVLYFRLAQSKENIFLPDAGEQSMREYYAELRRFARTDPLPLKDFAPRSNLVVSEHKIQRARFPVFEVHLLLPDAGMSPEEVVGLMDSCNIQKIVNLAEADLWGEQLAQRIALYEQKSPDRFLTAANVNFADSDHPGFSARAVAQLEESHRLGARALKISRDLGLALRDRNNQRIRLDDPRFAPLWQRAGELKMPVILDIAAPTAFWFPVDAYNERFEELQAHLTGQKTQWGIYGPLFETVTGAHFKLMLLRHPERLYYHSKFKWFEDFFPTKEELLVQRDRVLARHPQTIFIGAHFGQAAEDLAFVGRELARYPNYFVDISQAISELGRQPFTAREFFLNHQDRILFGLGDKPALDVYRAAFRFLETTDEYFDYPRVGAGRWKIYGIGLPDPVLEKIYYLNAEKIFFP